MPMLRIMKMRLKSAGGICSRSQSKDVAEQRLKLNLSLHVWYQKQYFHFDSVWQCLNTQYLLSEEIVRNSFQASP